MKKIKNTAAIIGAGISGMAAAIRLQNKGFEVSIFEANSYPGGKLSAFEQNDYRFDAGPSLFTMPHLVDELFLLSGKKPADYFEYIRLPVVCEYFYEDGTRITAHSQPEKFAAELALKTTEQQDSILEFLKNSQTKYELTADVFLHSSLHKLSTYINHNAFKGYLNFNKLDVFRTMHQANTAHFQDPRVVQLFNRYATYNGSDPYQTPATMNIIPHLEYNIGAYFPVKGMHAITLSLVALAEELGVKFYYEHKVDKILVDKKQAKGLQIAASAHFFDMIVSNMDVVNTYRRLLPTERSPQKILDQPKSSSALIFYWGITKEFKELSLHNIFFSQDYKEEFTHIFQKKSIYSDPTVYINITSKYKKDDAPEGCENWFVMINVPNNSGQNWDQLIQQARKDIISKLSRILKTDIGPLIACESILDPRTIERSTSSSQGALYGNSSNNRYAAFLRHANFSSQIKNLYFCGGSVHPGGGIPLCLLSAKIATELIETSNK